MNFWTACLVLLRRTWKWLMTVHLNVMSNNCKVDYLSLACATDGTINFPLWNSAKILVQFRVCTMIGQRKVIVHFATQVKGNSKHIPSKICDLRSPLGPRTRISVLIPRHYASLNSSCAWHLPTPGLFLSFWHAHPFLSEYNYTEDITGKKAHWLICQGQGVVKACSWFYACISSLLIKPELQS